MAKKTTSKKVVHIVSWEDECSEVSFKSFETEIAAKEFIKAILNREEDNESLEEVYVDEVDTKTIKLYKAELVGRPKITVSFE